MNFGVSGNMGACSSHIYSNPVTIAAVKRQQEKERLANDSAYRARKEYIERVKVQVAADLEAKEDRFRREFLFDITKLRMKSQKTCRVVEAKRVDLSASPLRRTSASEVIMYHAGNSGFTYEELIGSSRCQIVVKARYEAIADVYLLCPHLSMSQIGAAFGGRDHTSIYFAVKRMGVHHSQTGKERRMGNYIPLREALAA